jgi:RNA polymerase sigma factor (sigma-70 family)
LYRRVYICSMDSLQHKLTSYAYNITGSYEDAKDVVQDVYLQVMDNQETDIQNRKAYLTRAVINRAINVKKRQKKIVREYPGTWLPEPVATETADTSLHREDILHYSLMVLLEKLNARQRAVFILKEAFDYEHEEIAALLDISVENSRKLLSRAKKELQNPPAEPGKAPKDYLDKYMAVISSGDVKELEQLLTDEITVISDGGGKAVAFINPVAGKPSVMSLLLGLHRKFYHNVRIVEKTINHQPAFFYYDNNHLVTCQIFIVDHGRISHIYFIRNPDKLKELEKSR